ALVSNSGGLLGETDPQGRLTLMLPPGQALRLTAETADGRRAALAVAAAKPGEPTLPVDAPLRLRLGKPPERSAGRVLDRQDRRPLVGAFVWPSEDPGAFVRTDGTGTYALSLLARRKVRAAAAGHQTAPEAALAGREGPAFLLVPTSGAVGTVVDEAGRPVAGAEVTARPDRTKSVFGASLGRARSQADGRFILRRLTPGFDFLLRATHPGFAPAELDLPALPVQVPSAPRRPLRLVLRRGRTAHGEVVDGTGQPVAGAEVALLPSLDDLGRTDPQTLLEDLRQAASGPDGRFSLAGLAPGRFGLRVRAPGFATAVR